MSSIFAPRNLIAIVALLRYSVCTMRDAIARQREWRHNGYKDNRLNVRMIWKIMGESIQSLLIRRGMTFATEDRDSAKQESCKNAKLAALADT